jgi:hypothetical protein
MAVLTALTIVTAPTRTFDSAATSAMPPPQRAPLEAAAAAATAPADASAVNCSFKRACLSAAAIILTDSSVASALSLQLQLVLLLLEVMSLVLGMLGAQMMQQLVAKDDSSLQMTAAAAACRMTD